MAVNTFNRSARPLVALFALMAVGPATRPATGPAASPITGWVGQLCDADPAVRAAAFDHLMGLPADQLPRLREAVDAARPLRPGRAGALHEIVRQVWLSGDRFDVDPIGVADNVDGGGDFGPRYIMGQSWPAEYQVGARVGVPVVDRWPGFPARAALRDGDLILGLYADLGAAAGSPPDVPTHTVQSLVEGMRQCRTRPRVAMSVLRDGRTIKVTITCVQEPAITSGRMIGPTRAFLDDRDRRAEAYWQDQFAPLVDPPMADDGDGFGR